eukprot:m.88931 g.88931  ORF g.88931 m.88931 type:complete len:747 (-) comp13197_c0_seq2:2281-4521(-)
MSSTAPNASDGKDNDPAPSQDTAGEPEPNVAVKSDQEAEENSTPNKESATCTACGSQLRPSARFCDECGARISGQPDSAQSPKKTTPAGEDEVPDPIEWALSGLPSGDEVKDTVKKFSMFKSSKSRSNEKQVSEKQAEAEEQAKKLNASLQEAYQVERTNMLNMLKIGLKTLIESSIGYAKSLNEEFQPLKQLCTLLEMVLSHGLKKTISFTGNKGAWGVILSLEKEDTIISEICAQVKAMPLLKTNLGKARAFIRIVMMKKCLMDLFRILMNAPTRDSMYDKHAFVLSEEAQVLPGLLVSANIIDCEFELEPFILDGVPCVVDYSMYLKDGNYLKPAVTPSSNDDRFSEENFTILQDQKMMLQEKLKTAETRSQELESMLQEIQETQNQNKTKIEALESQVESQTKEITERKAELETVKQECERKLNSHAADIETERTTYEQSRSGLNEMFSAIEKQLDTEKTIREQTEEELKKAAAGRKEVETTLAEREADIQKKQDTIDALRTQLKEVKDLNMVMLTNMQDAQTKIKEAEMSTHRVTEDRNMLQKKIVALQDKGKEEAKHRQRLEKTILELSDRLQDVDAHRATLESNIAIERQYRQTVQGDLELEKTKVKELEPLIDDLAAVKAELAQLTTKHMKLMKSYEEQEQTLAELGSHISEEKLKLNEMEAKRRREREQTWKDDSDVQDCSMCKKKFGLARRKHHCRNCGGIFCNDCSDNKMPLPHSAKPVRVCDACEIQLMRDMAP